ncbi:MAG: hypothetical protein RJB38_147 [Pseudomonadota bacterium]|jgi:23S rRNA pseudouridine1911/1915/1917 synthase
MNTKVSVVYEDHDLLVIDKPSGTPSTAHSPEERGTAIHLALEHFPDLPFPHSLERGLLHRLDTATSGALAFAKTESAYAHYRTHWKTDVRKIYRALSLTTSPWKHDLPHLVSLEMGHDAKSSRRMRVLDAALPISLKEQIRRIRGKPQEARTTILNTRSLEKLPEALGNSSHADEHLLDFTMEIHTGVLHQIRAHLAHLGYPILGDPLYRGKPSHRLWLHAWKLFIAGQEIQAPLPSVWP